MTTDMFRIELLHPMIVHFPIALLVNAVLVRAILFVLKTPPWGTYLRAIYFWSLSLAAVGLFAAYLSGEKAAEIINPLICDPTVTHDHEDFAKFSILFALLGLIFATVNALFDKITARHQNDPSDNPKAGALTNALIGIEVFLLAASFASLAYTAHLGASLVYIQGAGYHRTADPNCQDSVQSLDTSGGNEETHSAEDK